MNQLLKILLLTLQQGGRSAAPQPQKVFWSVLAGIMIAASLTAATVLTFVALWEFLLPVLGVAFTPLVLAGVLLVLAMSVVAAMRLATPKRPAAVASPPPIALALDDAARLFNANKLTMLSAALLAGFALATSENPSRKRH